MFKVYLLNRIDFRGCNPIKVFALKDSAIFLKGECDISLKLISQSEDPEIEFDLLKQFDKNAVYCDNIRYEIEEIQTE